MCSKVGFYTLSLMVFVGSCTMVKEQLFNYKNSGVTKNRNPASIQRVYDFSGLQGRSLQMAVADRFASSTEVKYSGNHVVLQTGHFALFDNQQQETVFACGYYDKISFNFEGNNVIVDSENKPQLTIEADCEIASNVNYLIPTRVPLALLKNEKPGKIEKKFFEQNQSVTVRTDNIPSEWPTEWILKTIKLTHSKMMGRTLVVPTQKISMKW